MDPGLGRYCLPQASCQWEQPIRPDTPHIGIMTTTTTIMMSVMMILLIIVSIDPKGSTVTVTQFSCQCQLYYLNVPLVTDLIVTRIINVFGNLLLRCFERADSSQPGDTLVLIFVFACSTNVPHIICSLNLSSLQLASSV